MNKYKWFRPNKRVIGMRLTKANFAKVLELIANHGSVDKYAADAEDCRIDFTQHWPRESKQTLQRGMYITSENSGLRVYTKWDFENRYSEVHQMPSWYYPTPDEVKIIECLDMSDEYCYNYQWITGETGLSRLDAKKAIDNLRSMGVVEYYRGLMDDDGMVQGSGFCIGDVHRAEALLYRHYGQGNKNS